MVHQCKMDISPPCTLAPLPYMAMLQKIYEILEKSRKFPIVQLGNMTI